MTAMRKTDLDDVADWSELVRLAEDEAAYQRLDNGHYFDVILSTGNVGPYSLPLWSRLRVGLRHLEGFIDSNALLKT